MIPLGNALKYFISLQMMVIDLLSSSFCNYFYVCVRVCIFLYAYVCIYVRFMCVFPVPLVFRLQKNCV